MKRNIKQDNVVPYKGKSCKCYNCNKYKATVVIFVGKRVIKLCGSCYLVK